MSTDKIIGRLIEENNKLEEQLQTVKMELMKQQEMNCANQAWFRSLQGAPKDLQQELVRRERIIDSMKLTTEKVKLRSVYVAIVSLVRMRIFSPYEGHPHVPSRFLLFFYVLASKCCIFPHVPSLFFCCSMYLPVSVVPFLIFHLCFSDSIEWS